MDTMEHTPTPKPTPMARMMFCSGYTRETADRASFPNRATKILSTMLYRDCTVMEIMMGTDIFSSSARGCPDAMLFCVCFILPPKQKKTLRSVLRAQKNAEF